MTERWPGLPLSRPGQPQPDRAESGLGRLRADLTWMQVLDQGGSVVLEADEWVNKTSGQRRPSPHREPRRRRRADRGPVHRLLRPAPLCGSAARLFPWADLHLDENAIDDADEDLWMTETGIWDSEEDRYIGNSEDFAEWRASRFPPGELRPYSGWLDEVAHWRLTLTLNDLGRGVLALERYLATS